VELDWLAFAHSFYFLHWVDIHIKIFVSLWCCSINLKYSHLSIFDQVRKYFERWRFPPIYDKQVPNSIGVCCQTETSKNCGKRLYTKARFPKHHKRCIPVVRLVTSKVKTKHGIDNAALFSRNKKMKIVVQQSNKANKRELRRWKYFKNRVSVWERLLTIQIFSQHLIVQNEELYVLDLLSR